MNLKTKRFYLILFQLIQFSYSFDTIIFSSSKQFSSKNCKLHQNCIKNCIKKMYRNCIKKCIEIVSKMYRNCVNLLLWMTKTIITIRLVIRYNFIEAISRFFLLSLSLAELVLLWAILRISSFAFSNLKFNYIRSCWLLIIW